MKPLPLEMHLSGHWVGETQGCSMPAHLWEIKKAHGHLVIITRWEGQSKTVTLYGTVLPNKRSFSLGDGMEAILVDPMHFIIPGWCTNDTRDGVGPSYDVVFSRPGVPELLAHAVWQRYHGQEAED